MKNTSLLVSRQYQKQGILPARVYHFHAGGAVEYELHLQNGETHTDAASMNDGAGVMKCVHRSSRSAQEEMNYDPQEIQIGIGEMTADTDAGPAVVREINFFLQEKAANVKVVASILNAAGCIAAEMKAFPDAIPCNSMEKA